MSGQRLLIGSGNKGKIMEIEEFLHDFSMTFVTPAELGILEEPAEHGNTFEENASEKARFYFERSGLPTIADDSGIVVEALAGELGIHTRRWGAGKDATDAQWIEYFLNRMSKEKNKRAEFLCVLCFIDVTGNQHVFHGRCMGNITDTVEANYLPGLPISACFKPDGFAQVYSALSLEQKNSVSHRGKALLLFKEFLQTGGGAKGVNTLYFDA